MDELNKEIESGISDIRDVEYDGIAPEDYYVNEFKEKLWHKADEEPEITNRILIHNTYDGFEYIVWNACSDDWNMFKKVHFIKEWLYIKDLVK